MSDSLSRFPSFETPPQKLKRPPFSPFFFSLCVPSSSNQWLPALSHWTLRRIYKKGTSSVKKKGKKKKKPLAFFGFVCNTRKRHSLCSRYPYVTGLASCPLFHPLLHYYYYFFSLWFFFASCYTQARRRRTSYKRHRVWWSYIKPTENSMKMRDFFLLEKRTFNVFLFLYVTHRERERERRALGSDVKF